MRGIIARFPYSVRVIIYSIFSMLAEGGEMTVDELCCRLEKPPAYVNSIVTVMELKGAVYTALGKIFIAKA